ncbi:oxidoreductase [Kitasatospora sp. NPDC002227]|uniref:oxidoreductase n=1 Tax=Kitasatospora sp. NPDC002227 TaxID=3154773 RepID=UPI0033217D55
MSTGTDPLAPLAELPGVPEAVAEVRKAVDRLYGHRVMRRRASEVTSESALRGARASAALDGADWPLEEVRRRSDFSADPQARTLGGALRISAEAGQLLSVWRHSPLQVLARLHLLAVGDADPAAGRPRRAGEGAAELFPVELAPAEGVGVAGDDDHAGHDAHAEGGEHGLSAHAGGGREGAVDPLPAAPSAEEVAARLDQLSRLLVERVDGGLRGTPALVVSSVVHGELLALRPFGSHNGVVARAAQRIVLIAEGLDPKAICPAEVGFVELGTAAYREALAGYLSGTAEGMAAWIGHCGAALRLGVRESTAVCEAMQRGMV